MLSAWSGCHVCMCVFACGGGLAKKGVCNVVFMRYEVTITRSTTWLHDRQGCLLCGKFSSF